jgi:hypothetical protein
MLSMTLGLSARFGVHGLMGARRSAAFASTGLSLFGHW